MKEPVTIDFLHKDTTVNSASYCHFLSKNSLYKLNDLHIYIYIYSGLDVGVYILDFKMTLCHFPLMANGLGKYTL